MTQQKKSTAHRDDILSASAIPDWGVRDSGYEGVTVKVVKVDETISVWGLIPKSLMEVIRSRRNGSGKG